MNNELQRVPRPRPDATPSGMTAPLVGHVAIVTGGGQGIGRVIAGTLAAAGAAVAVIGRSERTLSETVDEIERAGGHAISIVADVTDGMAVTRMVDEVCRVLGPPTVLVNNVGRLKAVGPLWEIDPDEWWSEVEVNLRSAALCCWAVLPRMLEQRRGTIVNLSSISVLTRSGNDSAYTAAKAALSRLTTSLAAETAGKGIHVFAVNPGTVRTALTRHLMESPQGQQHFRFFQNLGPKEWADPRQVAQLCVTLATGRGARLSGHFIDAVDTPSKLFWRTIGKFGMVWRELYGMYLCRTGVTQYRAETRPALVGPPPEARHRDIV